MNEIPIKINTYYSFILQGLPLLSLLHGLFNRIN